MFKKSLLAAITFGLLYSVSAQAVCTRYQEYLTKVQVAREHVKGIEASLKDIERQLEYGDIDIFTRRELMTDRAARQQELTEITALEAKLARCIEHNIN